MCLMKFRTRRKDVYRTVWLPQSKLKWSYQGHDWNSVLSRPWNQGQNDHNSRKVNLCTKDMYIFLIAQAKKIPL